MKPLLMKCDIQGFMFYRRFHLKLVFKYNYLMVAKVFHERMKLKTRLVGNRQSSVLQYPITKEEAWKRYDIPLYKYVCVL